MRGKLVGAVAYVPERGRNQIHLDGLRLTEAVPPERNTMPTYYHLDRAGHFREGHVIERSRNSSPRWFPDGFSSHGEQYLNGTFQIKIVNENGEDRFAVSQDTGLELLWELVRLYEFPHAPSCLRSFFAFESLEDARQFQSEKKCGTIWEVETKETGFRADMALLHATPRTGDVRQLAQIFWLQTEDYDRSRVLALCGPPVWEILLSGPVQVVRAVG